MGLFNYLIFNTVCPRCGLEGEIEAEFRFGLKDLSRYRIGDQLRWDGMGVKTPEIRPKGGNYDDDAYAVCPHCEKDFWLNVSVRQDIITNVEIDNTREPYITDEAFQQETQSGALEYAGLNYNVGKTEPIIIVRRFPYEEPYHTHLEFVVSNGTFGGSTDIYCGVQDIQEIGEALQKFPARIGDEYCYKYGSEDPEVSFYRYFVLRAYTIDSVGHCAIQLLINLNTKEPDEGKCQFSIRAEAASVNRLGKLFEDFSKLEHLEFRWSLKESGLFQEYQLSDVPSAIASKVRTFQNFSSTPIRSSNMQDGWDQTAYAEKMKKSTWDVSAFFLIDSLEAFSRCTQWLSILKPYNMPDMEHSQYFNDVLEIYKSGRDVINFDYDFVLFLGKKEFKQRLRCHSAGKGKYEIELWLPGVIANEIADKFKDGHEGFYCKFMPPAFYD
jgi:hypothetical protein